MKVFSFAAWVICDSSSNGSFLPYDMWTLFPFVRPFIGSSVVSVLLAPFGWLSDDSKGLMEGCFVGDFCSDNDSSAEL